MIVGTPAGSQHALDRQSEGQQGNLAALAVVQGRTEVDTERLVDRRGGVGGCVRRRDGVGAAAVRRADHLTALHPAAGEEDRAGAAPVVAAAVLVDLRRAA